MPSGGRITHPISRCKEGGGGRGAQAIRMIRHAKWWEDNTSHKEGGGGRGAQAIRMIRHAKWWEDNTSHIKM